MTAQIVQLRPSGVDLFAGMSPEFRDFAIARQAMNRAYWRWLQSDPAPADVARETAATTTMVQQIHEMERG